MNNVNLLIQRLNPKFIKINEPLSLHTTVGIGGPAEIWYEPDTNQEFIFAIQNARSLGINVTILGRGSNVLISDNGIKGLVIKNGSKNIAIGKELPIKETKELELSIEKISHRWASDRQKGTFKYEFKDLDYTEENAPRIEVILDSGVDMPFAINYLINKGITGLQWYARIPGNLGGWIYNNVHGGTHFINEVIKSVDVLDSQGNIKTLLHKDLEFEYDQSIFHNSNDVILSAKLNLYLGDKEKAKYVAMEWAKRKSIQPHKSTGSVFKNISTQDQKLLGYPTVSIGYIIEHILKLSGYKFGNAAISNKHHGFIENLGNATAIEYLKVIETIQQKALKEIGIKLIPEIFFLGFTPNELSSIILN